MKQSRDKVARTIESRRIARALRMIGPVTAREMRVSWTATDKRFGTGRYRWYRKGLRAELARMALAGPTPMERMINRATGELFSE